MNWSRPLVAAALAALLAACGSDSLIATGSPASAPPASAGSSDAPLHAFAADPGRITEYLAALQDIADEHDGTRFSGTAGYDASVDYAAEALRDLGFDVETPEVEFTGFAELPGSTLEVGSETSPGLTSSTPSSTRPVATSPRPSRCSRRAAARRSISRESSRARSC
jgi:hypothetical protein